MMGRVGWLLVSLAVLTESQVPEEFCEGKVQAALDNLKQCRVTAGIDGVDNGCGCDGEEDRKKKDCEWASRVGVVSYVNAMANVCAKQGVSPPNLSIAQPTVADTCVPEIGFYQTCLVDHSVVKNTPVFNQQECECVVPVHTYLRSITGTPCADILLPFLAADTEEYHIADGACTNCSSQLLCLPVEEIVEDSPFYEAEVRLKTQEVSPFYLEDDKELLRGSIAHYAEVGNSQVHFFKVDRVVGDTFALWFMLLGLPFNTTEATQGKLEASIESASVLSTNYQMTPMTIVNEPFREVVVTEDEVPTWMIVLLVISLTALVVAAVGGAFVFFTGKGDGGEEEDEEDEEGEDNVQMSERGDEETGEPVRKPLPAGDEEHHNSG